MTTSFNRLDLNLLRVFDAVMEERSVLRASQRVFLSQSAVSHSLARLREMLDDELFLRTPTGMQPTARALAMAPMIKEAWRVLHAAIELPKFEPPSSTRRFAIAASDFVAAVVVPRLLEMLRCEAPLIDVAIEPAARIDLAEQVDLGRIDAAIGTFSDIPQRFQSNVLFAYDDVLISHSSQALGKLSLEKLGSLSIAVVSLHGEDDGIVDGFVSERGLSRRSEMYDRAAFERAFLGTKRNPRIAISLPHFLALPALLEQPHLGAIVPRPLARALAQTHPLSIYELPYKTSLLEVRSLWHRRIADDSSQRWLLDILKRATHQLRVDPVEFVTPLRSAASLARAGAEA